jgi:hypothetical protein
VDGDAFVVDQVLSLTFFLILFFKHVCFQILLFANVDSSNIHRKVNLKVWHQFSRLNFGCLRN